MLYQWSMPINSDQWRIKFVALTFIDQHFGSITEFWSAIDRYWTALIIDTACPVLGKSKWGKLCGADVSPGSVPTLSTAPCRAGTRGRWGRNTNWTWCHSIQGEYSNIEYPHGFLHEPILKRWCTINTLTIGSREWGGGVLPTFTAVPWGMTMMNCKQGLLAIN